MLGLGSIGLRHAGLLREAGRAVLGYDPDPARRQAFAAAGGKATADRAEAIGAAAAVIVASPNACHLADMRDAIGAGRHVFVEKPLAHTAAGVAGLLAAAEAGGLVVFAAMHLRYHPLVERAAAALAAGRIGTPLWARLLCASYLPDWRPGRDYRTGYAADPATGGVLFDIVHEFDLANHLLGPAEAVAAEARRTGRLEIAAEDCADVILRHRGGLRSSLHLDYVTRPPRRITEIAGTEGALRLDLGAGRLTRSDPDGRIVEDETVAGGMDAGYREEVLDFLACIRGEAHPRADGPVALAVLEQVLAARRMAGLPAAVEGAGE